MVHANLINSINFKYQTIYLFFRKSNWDEKRGDHALGNCHLSTIPSSPSFNRKKYFIYKIR